MAPKKTGTPPKKAAQKKRKHRRGTSPSRAPRSSFDPRANEKVLSDLGRLFEQHRFQSIEEANAFLEQFIGRQPPSSAPESLAPLERAQDKMYEAWGATGDRRVKLAREALDISPLCADAYVLLAEETARTPEDAIELYELGMQVGERAVGADIFEEGVGHFWGILETRPYMRARRGLADCLQAIGEFERAIAHYRELLRLNPGDNQGNRYLLARILLRQGMDDELSRLLDEYDEESAEWVYTRVLVTFRREGASRRAARLLRAAFDVNPWVPPQAFGIMKAPRRMPEYFGHGDENEAIVYLCYYGQSWLDTPGAMEWLAEEFAKAVREIEERDAPDAPAGGRRPR